MKDSFSTRKQLNILISAWGENFFIAVQVTIILCLMFYYNQNIIYLGAFAPVYGVLVWYLTSQYVSLTVLSTLQGCVIPLVISSRVSLKQKEDQRVFSLILLSCVTVCLNGQLNIAKVLRIQIIREKQPRKFSSLKDNCFTTFLV